MKIKRFNLVQEYFKRQIELLGDKTQDNLQKKHIIIVGSGGLGCSLGIALGGCGIGKITLIDFDKVSLHNIHRQIGFSLKDINKSKSKVLKQHLQNRSTWSEFKAFDGDFETYIKTNNKIDLIIDATDNLPSRGQIDKYAKQLNIPWIYGSVEEFHGQVCFFDKSSFKELFQITNRTPKGIATPNVMQIASFQANLALRYLSKLPIKKDLLYYIFFNDNGELILQKFKLPKINL